LGAACAWDRFKIDNSQPWFSKSSARHPLPCAAFAFGVQIGNAVRCRFTLPSVPAYNVDRAAGAFVDRRCRGFASDRQHGWGANRCAPPSDALVTHSAKKTAASTFESERAGAGAQARRRRAGVPSPVRYKALARRPRGGAILPRGPGTGPFTTQCPGSRRHSDDRPQAATRPAPESTKPVRGRCRTRNARPFALTKEGHVIVEHRVIGEWRARAQPAVVKTGWTESIWYGIGEAEIREMLLIVKTQA